MPRATFFFVLLVLLAIPLRSHAQTRSPGQVRAVHHECSWCHLPTAGGKAIPLWANTPIDLEAGGSAPRQFVCLTCHDGTTAPPIENDATNRRGHPIGVTLPLLSTSLPLANGKVACTTCHDQHADVKLRVENSDGKRLCRNCHRR